MKNYFYSRLRLPLACYLLREGQTRKDFSGNVTEMANESQTNYLVT